MYHTEINCCSQLGDLFPPEGARWTCCSDCQSPLSGNQPHQSRPSGSQRRVSQRWTGRVSGLCTRPIQKRLLVSCWSITKTYWHKFTQHELPFLKWVNYGLFICNCKIVRQPFKLSYNRTSLFGRPVLVSTFIAQTRTYSLHKVHDFCWLVINRNNLTSVQS